MDFLSHATLGATAAILICGRKDAETALLGAALGVLPDLLGAPITEGYHLLRAGRRVFTRSGFNEAFLPGTTHRWERLPDWIIGYYQFLHTVWFALLLTILVSCVYPAAWWWGPTMFFSHSFVDFFLHRDEPGCRFPRGIRPFWPLAFSIQLVQWSEIPGWVKPPLVPLLFQVGFWSWFLTGRS
jgi:hypothetical protein